MLHFLNPWFLTALVAAGIPLFLHLLQRRRVVRVPFSTLRFLHQAQKRASRRLRLEHFFLWLLRTLLIVLLALGFAMPMLRTRALSELLVAAPRDVALIIDRSGSMRYRLGKARVWDEVVGAAEDLVNGLQEGDRICVFAAEETPVAIIEKLTADRGLVTRQLQALEPGYGRSRLGPCIQAAYEALCEQSGSREREVHVLTDGQLVPWQELVASERDGDSSTTRSLFAEEDDRTILAIALLGPSTAVNASPLDVRLSPAVLTEGIGPQITVQLGSTGGAAPPVVTLTVDGVESGRRALSAEEAAHGTTVMSIGSLGAGVHAAEVRLPADNLEADDVFYFLLRVEPSLRCLAVGDPSEIFFLRKALEAGKGSSIDAEYCATSEVAQYDLSRMACVFLAGVRGLSGPAVMSLDRYVQAGGVLVVFADATAEAGDYSNLVCLPKVLSAGRAIAAAEQKREMHWEAPRHPLLSNLISGQDASPVLNIKRLLQWERDEARDAVLVAVGPESPLLLERSHGEGRVLVFTVTAGREWSSFPLATHFLPLLHESVRYGGGIRRLPLAVNVGRSLALADDIRLPIEVDELRGPHDRRVPLRRQREDGRMLTWADGLDVPGIYTALAGAQPAPAVLAVNFDRRESDLAVLDPVRLPDLTGSDNQYVVAGREEMEQVTRSYRVGQTLGEHLIWLVLLLGTAEVVLANRMARRHAPLSAALKVEATGRVRGGRMS